jgi:hypothetical protein
MFGFTLLRSLKLAALDLVAGRTALAQRTLAGWRDGWFQAQGVHPAVNG